MIKLAFAKFRSRFRTVWLLSRKAAGFSVLELLIFSALFTIAAISFLTVLVSVTRVQVRQNAVAEVNQQSQFLLQTIQRYVEQSSLVELDANVATTTLKLRMSSSSYDPTYVYLDGNMMYVRETESGAAQPLSSDKVIVSDVRFTKRSNPGGHDSVAVSFTVTFNALNIQQRFSQALRTAIARVSAATFDSDIVPAAAGILKIGSAAGAWQSINNTVFFFGSNVGIGVTPNAKFQVSGDIYVDTASFGLVLRDSAGKCWRIKPTIGGVLSTATTSDYGCPP